MDEIKKGTLFVVATPIGNMEDITLRAMRILNHADAIVCEDTRVAKKLLFKYEIEGKILLAISQRASEDKMRRIVEWIEAGKQVAMVCDAGTPGLSDPGNAIVEAVVAAGGTVSPIPGASALTAMVSVAGINMQEFLFKGFPPHKKGRQTYFTEVAATSVPVIYYDSPHRVVKNLELLQELAPEKRVVIGRELTKMFEEVIRGTVAEALTYYQENESKVKGEFVVLVY
ncbi:MAG: 16S rRNA (cytidine(1402)-2'-O)-methyltransferase [Candidatus Moraniibacteriota bacterium]